MGLFWVFVAILVLPAVAQAQFKCTTNNGKVTITGYTGSGRAVNIPRTTDGLPVTSIGNSAFCNCTNLTNVTIPNTVTNIGHRAFNCCINLTSVKIGNGVASIGVEAFGSCINLTNISIGNTIVTMLPMSTPSVVMQGDTNASSGAAVFEKTNETTRQPVQSNGTATATQQHLHGWFGATGQPAQNYVTTTATGTLPSTTSSQSTDRLDITTKSGVTFTRCKVSNVTYEGVVVIHSKGVATIPFSDLLEEDQIKYPRPPPPATPTEPFVVSDSLGHNSPGRGDHDDGEQRFSFARSHGRDEGSVAGKSDRNRDSLELRFTLDDEEKQRIAGKHGYKIGTEEYGDFWDGYNEAYWRARMR